MAFTFQREDFNTAAYDAALQDEAVLDNFRALVSIFVDGVYYRYIVSSRDLEVNGNMHQSNPFLSFSGGISRAAGSAADRISMSFDAGGLSEASGHTNIVENLTQAQLRGAPVQLLVAYIVDGVAIGSKLKFAGRIEKAPLDYQTQIMKFDVISYLRIAKDSIPLTSTPVSHTDRFGLADTSLNSTVASSITTVIWNADS